MNYACFQLNGIIKIDNNSLELHGVNTSDVIDIGFCLLGGGNKENPNIAKDSDNNRLISAGFLI